MYRSWGFLLCAAVIVVGGLFTLESNVRASEPKPSCAESTYCATANCCRCGIVTKPWRVIEYETQKRVFYKTVYEEVKEEHPVETAKYVDEIRYRCVPCTIWQDKQTPGCNPGCCGSCGEASCDCVKSIPESICRKVPFIARKPVPVVEQEERTRLIVKQVPYTVEVCIPRVVIKEMPVKVCCPKRCCKKCEACRGRACECGDQP